LPDGAFSRLRQCFRHESACVAATAVNNAWNYSMQHGYVLVHCQPAKENPA